MHTKKTFTIISYFTESYMVLFHKKTFYRFKITLIYFLKKKKNHPNIHLKWDCCKNQYKEIWSRVMMRKK